MLRIVLVVLAVAVPRAAWAQAPANDACASALVVPALPFTHQQSTVAATPDDGDPAICGLGGGPTVWFHHTPAGTGVLCAETCGSNYDTVLAAHGGSCGAFQALACNDDSDCGPGDTSGVSSRIEVPVTSGVPVLIEAARFNGAGRPGGSLTLRLFEVDDLDGDGRTVCAGDNCPSAANSDQADGDGDGVGDACDRCPTSPGAGGDDGDGDGRPDACDVCPADPSDGCTSLLACRRLGATDTLLRVDPTRGASQPIGPLAFFCSALALEPAGLLYGVGQDVEQGENAPLALWVVDPTTAAARQVGPLGQAASLVSDLAFRSDRRLLAVDAARWVVGTIDPATGLLSPIGPLGIEAVAPGLEFLTDDALLLSSDALHVVDQATGAAAVRSPLGIPAPLQCTGGTLRTLARGAAAGPLHGTLHCPDPSEEATRVHLVTVDPTNGAIGVVAEVGWLDGLTGPYTPPVVARCGNGRLEPGEACDDGNTAGGDCCSSTCAVEPAGALCRPAAGLCDVAETCDGTAPSCPADVRSSGLCRPSTGLCDAPERCDGVRADCPPDAAVADGTGCDACDGAVCRAAACEVPAVCEGEIVRALGSPVVVGSAAATEIEVVLDGPGAAVKAAVTAAGFVDDGAPRAARSPDGVQVTKRAKAKLARKRPRRVLRLRLNGRGRALLRSSGVLRVVLVVRVRDAGGTSTFRFGREWRS